MKPLLGAMLGATTVFFALPTHGQQFPSQPITLVVPFAPGGANDTVARVVARSAESRLGVPIVVENKGGAGGTIGTEQVARARPDGYTILLVSAAHAINPLVYPNLGYDGVKDFTPVIQLTESPYVLVVGRSVPAKSVKELIGLARSAPGRYTYASSGTGSAPHLAGALLGNMSGTELEHVPYKGGAPALIDVVRGDVTMYFSSVPSAAPHLQSGGVRALAVSTSKRVGSMPDIPTVAESGVPGYELTGWYGILAPAKTPPEVIDRLNQAFNAALADDTVKKQLAMEGSTPMGGPSSVMATLIEKDMEKYAKMASLIKTQ